MRLVLLLILTLSMVFSGPGAPSFERCDKGSSAEKCCENDQCPDAHNEMLSHNCCTNAVQGAEVEVKAFHFTPSYSTLAFYTYSTIYQGITGSTPHRPPALYS